MCKHGEKLDQVWKTKKREGREEVTKFSFFFVGKCC